MTCLWPAACSECSNSQSHSYAGNKLAMLEDEPGAKAKYSEDKPAKSKKREQIEIAIKKRKINEINWM